MIDPSTIPPKHPDSSKWYWIEWSATELDNAPILTSTWTVPSGITVADSTFVGYYVGVKLSGGTDGEMYEIVNKITTDAPRTETLHEIMRVCVLALGGH